MWTNINISFGSISRYVVRERVRAFIGLQVTRVILGQVLGAGYMTLQGTVTPSHEQLRLRIDLVGTYVLTT